MAVPFWDWVHADVASRRAEAGYTGQEPPGYEENESLNANPWDRLILNNALVPGVSAVKVAPKFVIDVKKKTDRDGGQTIDKGCDAARVDIQITIWTPGQWENLQRLLEQTIRRAGQKLPTKDAAKAIQIAHPACAMWGITAVVIESAESPEPAPQVGAMLIRLRGIQYIAPVKQSTTQPVKGYGLKNVDPTIKGVRNGIQEKAPSQTQATARPRITPNQGGTGI